MLCIIIIISLFLSLWSFLSSNQQDPDSAATRRKTHKNPVSGTDFLFAGYLSQVCLIIFATTRAAKSVCRLRRSIFNVFSFHLIFKDNFWFNSGSCDVSWLPWFTPGRESLFRMKNELFWGLTLARLQKPSSLRTEAAIWGWHKFHYIYFIKVPHLHIRGVNKPPPVHLRWPNDFSKRKSPSDQSLTRCSPLYTDRPMTSCRL